MVAAAARHRASQRPPGPDPKSPWRAGFPAVPGWGVRERPGEGTPGSVCAGSASAGAWEASERLRPRRPRIPSLEPRSGPRTKRRVSLAPALWPTALPGSGSDGEVVVSRGPLAERPLARGLPAERQGARQGGLGSGRGSGFPRERAPWEAEVGGAGRAPGGGLDGHAGLPLPPQRSTLAGTDSCKEGRCALASRKAGWHASRAGGRQVRPGQERTAEKGRGHAAPPWRARRGLGRLAVAGERRRAGGASAEDGVRSWRESWRGRPWKQGCEGELAVPLAEVGAPAKRGGLATRRGAACFGAAGGGAGRGGAVAVEGGGWARVGVGRQGGGREAGKAAAAGAARWRGKRR